MIKKEKISNWIKDHSSPINLCNLVIGLIGLVITITLAWRLMGKIMIVILIFVLMAIFLFITIKSAIFLIRKPLNDEMINLESKLEDKTTKYNELFEKTKPPHSNIDSLIKAEAKSNFGAVRVLNDDYLSFDIRVISRTNYFFTAKEVSLACYHDDNCLFDKVWKDWAPTKYIFPSSLKVLEGGNIEFRVPIQKIDNNMRELMLSVKAEYTTEEVIIHDTQRKNVKVESKNLKYRLDEETIQKIERKGGKTNEAR